MSSRRERKKLVKLKHEIDLLQLDIHQWGLKLCSHILYKDKQLDMPLTFNKEWHVDNEDRRSLLPRFDEHENKGKDRELLETFKEEKQSDKDSWII